MEAGRIIATFRHLPHLLMHLFWIHLAHLPPVNLRHSTKSHKIRKLHFDTFSSPTPITEIKKRNLITRYRNSS
ncbi:hypothetical protein DFQ50_10657 [Pseudocitrobacter faecalis]|uniref:Uncharacterized protein n=1 Tax=Pseudocitrobacter faecalis TaxID=1398493 RepID=A0ABX9FXJ0_9ENTR|nr:hypothetical protein DFQ50_10657 [Pseudocitrobacter faecalis]